MDMKIPENLKHKYEIGDLYLRKFGINNEDLIMDFNHTSLIRLTTSLLVNCVRQKDGSPCDEKFLWELPLSKRIELLFRIAILSINQTQDYILTCKNESCQKDIGFGLQDKKFLSLLSETNNYENKKIKLGNAEYKLRKPNGLDQLNWAEKNFKSKEEAIFKIISTLIDRKNLNIEILKKIENSSDMISSAFEKIDPLINLQFEITCPLCEEKDSYHIDINKFSITILNRIQRDLLYSIHLMASFYHWDEKIILALPLWRRQYYLKLIRDEVR